MDPDALDLVVEITQGALIMTLKLSLPLLGVGLVVGLAISLFQAVTQIQEQTLGFAVKLVAVAITILLSMNWMGAELYNYTLSIFDNIHLVGR